ncbi:hypothetical protein GCM10023093_14730 [Nemorincola caseinilytica]|uniref:EGF-like domain-containing protein n=1 Tax=Nemorincola caseinilytica TaxID=2054315 RepID=A0ABP8NEC5_9BACT
MASTLKTIFISSIATIAAFGAVVYSSCNRDKCKSIVCANGGVCNDGSCTCPSGYEGTNCEKVSRDKFLGNWHVLEKGSITLAAQYPISIEPTTNLTDVVIKNFYNYFKTPIKATIIGGDSIVIPNQQYEGKVLFGIGHIYSNVTYGQYGAIEMRYEIIDTATQRVNDFGYNEAVDHSDPSQWNK